MKLIIRLQHKLLEQQQQRSPQDRSKQHQKTILNQKLTNNNKKARWNELNFGSFHE
jgi:hypothetical protein